jgi:hypothetical protein
LSKAFADNPVLIKQFQSKYLGFKDLGLIFKKYNDEDSSTPLISANEYINDEVIPWGPNS